MDNNISNTFKDGEIVQFKDITLQIVRKISEGGQGEIYEVLYNNRRYALKYSKFISRDYFLTIEKLIANPINTGEFIMPLHLVEKTYTIDDTTITRFGYVMELLPDNFIVFNKVLADENIRHRFTFENRIKAALNLVCAFNNLHAGGYSYKDINLGNVCIDVNNGDILIIDNDNITINNYNSVVLGTSCFMAPELVEKQYTNSDCIPNSFTDLHSIAVLLFIIFFVNHPLEGNLQGYSEVTSEDDLNRILYGKTAKFIFADEKDLTKYITKEQYSLIYMWEALPLDIQRLFRSAFIEGINDKHARPDTKQWISAFLDLHRRYYRCPYCGDDTLYDRYVFKKYQGAPYCGNKACGSIINLPTLIITPIYCIDVLYDEKVIYTADFNINSYPDNTPLLVTDYKNGKLRFKKYTDIPVIINGQDLKDGSYSKYLDTELSMVYIKVNGEEYPIILPKRGM